jgi:hypothetical protein
MFFEINKSIHLIFKNRRLKYKKFSFQKLKLSQNKTCYSIVSNKSVPIRKKTDNELFSQAEEIKFLMPKNKDVDFIIYAKDSLQIFH